jgi:hypothetical protein
MYIGQSTKKEDTISDRYNDWIQVIQEKVNTIKWCRISEIPDALFNPFTASCENAMSLSVPGVPAPCEKFPHCSQLN